MDFPLKPLRRTSAARLVRGSVALAALAALMGALNAPPAHAQITQKWASRFSLTTTSSETAAALTLDPVSGAVVVAGTVETGASSGADFLVVKYDKNGALLWKRQLIPTLSIAAT